MKKTNGKVTPASADINYEADITAKAKEYAPLVRESFPTETALLIALDNSIRFLNTAYEALDGNVTAEYFCLHSPLSEYPDQLLTLMMLFISSGVFYPVTTEYSVFSLANADKWRLNKLNMDR